MPWRLVRLEHGSTAAFPTGSVVRVYLLRIPLKTNGHIDPDTHALDPRRSTVRRYWPSEPDRSGYIVRGKTRWRLVSITNTEVNSEIGWFEDCAFVPAAQVPIVEPSNGKIPFEVTDIRVD